MKNKQSASSGYLNYLKGIKKEARQIHWLQILFCLSFLILWEMLASYGVIDDFIFSKPSAIWSLLMKYISTGEIFKHLGISLYETLVGLVIGTLGGVFIAICLWWSNKLAKVLDPALVVLKRPSQNSTSTYFNCLGGNEYKGNYCDCHHYIDYSNHYVSL